jgi:hypothetical protein
LGTLKTAYVTYLHCLSLTCYGMRFSSCCLPEKTKNRYVERPLVTPGWGCGLWPAVFAISVCNHSDVEISILTAIYKSIVGIACVQKQLRKGADFVQKAIGEISPCG